MERRIVAQMLTCMDDLAAPPAAAAASSADGAEAGAAATDQQQQQQHALQQGHVVVIGATNRPDALDPALRRAGGRTLCLCDVFLPPVNNVWSACLSRFTTGDDAGHCTGNI